MATTEMVTAYPDWIKYRWAAGDTYSSSDALFDAITTMRKGYDVSTAPVWGGPTAATNYFNSMTGAVEDLLGINAITLWESIRSTYNVTAALGVAQGEFLLVYKTDKLALDNQLVEQNAVQRSDFLSPISQKGNELYSLFLAADKQITEDMDDLLVKLNESNKASLEDVYDRVLEQHLFHGTIFTSVCYNWILDQYEKMLNKGQEFTLKWGVDALSGRADRLARLIEVSGQAFSNGKQLGISQDKMTLDGQLNRAELALKAAAGSADNYTQGMITSHEVAGKILQSQLQVEEIQAKMASTLHQIHFQMDLELAKIIYANAITSKKWGLDLTKYNMEALASLQGASPLSKSSSESGWDAMSGVEKVLSVASVGASMAAGVGSLLKAFK